LKNLRNDYGRRMNNIHFVLVLFLIVPLVPDRDGICLRIFWRIVVQFFAGSVRCPPCVDTTDAVKIAHSFGCKVMMQVGTVEEGILAMDYGVNAVIAQGTEAGGHGVRRELGCGSLSLTSQLVERSIQRKKPIPILAAGGIVDGRDVASVLALGADGLVM